MKIQRQRLPKSHINCPAEVYYTATARTPDGRLVAWGSTPHRARLNWLWAADRRRTRIES